MTHIFTTHVILLQLFFLSFLVSNLSLLLNFFLFKALKVILLLIFFYFLIPYLCFFHFNLYLSFFCCSFFSVLHFFCFCFLLLLNFSQYTSCAFLPLACRISFASHVLLTFISDVNVHEWLLKKKLIFNILLQVPCLHEI